jgi:hypothetical protein
MQSVQEVSGSTLNKNKIVKETTKKNSSSEVSTNNNNNNGSIKFTIDPEKMKQSNIEKNKKKKKSFCSML